MTNLLGQAREQERALAEKSGKTFERHRQAWTSDNSETPPPRRQKHEPPRHLQGDDEERGIDPGTGEGGWAEGEQAAVSFTQSSSRA